MAKKTKKRVDCQSIIDGISSGINHLGAAFNALRVIGPVYVTSIGLAAAYSWGWLETYPGVFGVALACVVVTCELLKPVIGPEIEKRLAERGRRAWKVRALAGVAIVTLAICGVSSVVAFNAAEAPQRAYEAGLARVEGLERRAAEARQALARFDCTADMPFSRCERNKAANAEAEARATATLGLAERELAAAREAQPPAPETTLPDVPLIVKLALGLAIDFILFIFPWAARAETAATVVRVAAEDAPVLKPAPKVNDGGWETRRAKYGPSGLKRRANVVPLRAAG